MIYLDYAAATPVDPEVFKAMKPWFTEKYGNPGSLHQLGQEASAAIGKARMSVAQFLGCQPTEVYFTSSATESCNWALLGTIEKRLLSGQQAHLIVTSIEHSAVLETARFLERAYGVQVSYLPVKEEGIIDPLLIEREINPDTVLVSIMMVNSEIGTLQPIETIGKLCREKGVYLHTDACQAAGYYPLDFEKLNVDLLTINATKIFGPKGVGVLAIREGVQISPWTFGGGQELKMRAGTENVPAIVGMGKAVELIQDSREEMQGVAQLRDQLLEMIQKAVQGIEVNGSMKERVPNNLNLFVEGVDGTLLVKKMDLKGCAISFGSACGSGLLEPSHVILGLGYDEDRASSSIRISLSKQTTLEEIQQFVEIFASVVHSLRS